MTLSRRKFVTRLSAAALGTIGARTGAAHSLTGSIARQIPHNRADAALADPDRLRPLAMSAIDAARSAGASFADVRMTRTIMQFGSFTPIIHPGGIDDQETLAIGVRALVDGYWGFAASPYWDVDEAAQLARDAVAQAKYYAQGSARHAEIGTLPPVTGTWTMPVKIDPFTVSIEEKIDYFTARLAEIKRYWPYAPLGFLECTRQERTVANTEGSYFTQVVYCTGGQIGVIMSNGARPDQWRSTTVGFDDLEYSGRGWEIFSDLSWDTVRRVIAQGEEYVSFPTKPLDVGRYDVVLDARVAAMVLGQTLGIATELDRALGYEANAGGTSFLGPKPMDLLGTFRTGSQLVNVTANRTETGGIATVKWDDEGVVAQRFPLVQDGMLTDYQTTRESAAWIAPWYTKQGKAATSHGCASAEAADAVTMQHCPNIVLEPATSDISRDDLIKQVKKGIFFEAGHSLKPLHYRGKRVIGDFQGRTGIGMFPAREIVDGKLGAVITRAAFSFDTVELWKNVIEVGGKNGRKRVAMESTKGEPEQVTRHSVSAVPMAVTRVAVVDPQRKA